MAFRPPFIAVGVLALGLVAPGPFAGCAGNHPRLWHPGTIQQQRLRATIHDPYPDPDMGPKIDGGRPRDYAEPLPEPVRNRLYADSWWWR
jgi:hypothetical protein